MLLYIAVEEWRHYRLKIRGRRQVSSNFEEPVAEEQQLLSSSSASTVCKCQPERKEKKLTSQPCIKQNSPSMLCSEHSSTCMVLFLFQLSPICGDLKAKGLLLRTMYSDLGSSTTLCMWFPAEGNTLYCGSLIHVVENLCLVFPVHGAYYFPGVTVLDCPPFESGFLCA